MGEAARNLEDGNVIWRPNQGSQTLFLECPIWECLYEGTRGRGATDAFLFDFAQHVGRGYGSNWRGILFRVAYPDLAEVVARSRRWFARVFPRAKFNRSEYFWEWPDGEQLFFRYMSDPGDYDRAYHGHEYAWIGWEEVTSWANADCYEVMKSCSRSSCPGMPRKYRANTNSYGIGHGWVKRHFIDPAPTGTVITDEFGRQRITIKGHFLENQPLMLATPDYIAQLAGQPNPARRKAWLEGDWNVVAGGMFDEAWMAGQPEMAPFSIPSNWYVDNCHDWGGSASPYATLWFAESNGEEVTLRDGTRRAWPRGHVFIIGEDYGHDENAKDPNTGLGLTSKEIVERALKEEADLRAKGILSDGHRVVRGPGDGIWAVTDGRSIADEMAKAGIRWQQPAKGKGSRVAGWQSMLQRLKANTKHPMEEPGLSVFSNCRNTIRTVSALPRDKKNPDDVDSESEDHCGDVIRYRLTANKSTVESCDIW